ncbi:hypothetical protein BMI90_18320 [Thioclava sp. L04-15]|nr:hypothetical protein BMI90_18320 [Thioclava sp. L04-15]
MPTNPLASFSWIAMRTSLRLTDTDFAWLECELREMVDLRNKLVHHFIDQHDIGTSDGCRAERDTLRGRIVLTVA